MKLTVLGGAGIRVPLLIEGLLKDSPPLFDTVVLYDVDRERLRLIHAMAEDLVHRSGKAIRVEYSNDFKKATAGADFVFSAVRVGQNASRVIDETVALKYGVVGQETTGPGGFAMALRTIPVVLKYAHMIHDVAPDAWLLNFTNPAGIITQALLDYGDVPTIGICDSPLGIQHRLAKFLHVDPELVELDYVGLNHLGWVRDIRVQGVSRMARVLDTYEELRASDAEFQAFDTNLVRSLGMLPNEYLYYYYYGHDAVENVASVGETRGQQIVHLADQLFADLTAAIDQGSVSKGWQIYERAMHNRSTTYMQREMHSSTADRADRAQGGHSTGYAEVALKAVRGMMGSTSDPFILNVQNHGAIGDLSADDVVEVPTVVTRSGPHPLAMGRLSPAISGLVQQVKAYERMTVEASVHGNPELAIEALAIHPLIPSYHIAEAIFRDYREQLAAWLPQFH